MAIGHIGLEKLGQNWQSDESWRADGPRELVDSEHQGRDMMCTGRGTIPWPMPDGRLSNEYLRENKRSRGVRADQTYTFNDGYIDA